MIREIGFFVYVLPEDLWYDFYKIKVKKKLGYVVIEDCPHGMGLFYINIIVFIFYYIVLCNYSHIHNMIFFLIKIFI